MRSNAFTDEWLADREQRLRDVVWTLFGLGAVLNLLSEMVGVEGSLWHLIRVAVGVAFFAALVMWLGALLWRRVPGGQDFARRRTWVRRVRIVGLVAALGTLALALIRGDFPLTVVMVGVGGALAYDLLREERT